MSESAPEVTPAGSEPPVVEVPAEDWKDRFDAQQKVNRDLERKFNATRNELTKIKESSMDETQKAIEKARQEGETNAMGRLGAERVLDRVEVAAAKSFADPEDARLRLAGHVADLTNEDGSPDVKAIQTALASLLKASPHLAAMPSRAQGAIDQGARGDIPAEFDMNDALLRAAGRR